MKLLTLVDSNRYNFSNRTRTTTTGNGIRITKPFSVLFIYKISVSFCNIKKTKIHFMKHQKYNIFPPIQSQMTHMHMFFSEFLMEIFYYTKKCNKRLSTFLFLILLIDKKYTYLDFISFEYKMKMNTLIYEYTLYIYSFHTL